MCSCWWKSKGTRSRTYKPMWRRHKTMYQTQKRSSQRLPDTRRRTLSEDCAVAAVLVSDSGWQNKQCQSFSFTVLSREDLGSEYNGRHRPLSDENKKAKAQSTFRLHLKKKGRLCSDEDLAWVLTCNTSGYIKISQDVIMSCYITLCKV